MLDVSTKRVRTLSKKDSIVSKCEKGSMCYRTRILIDNLPVLTMYFLGAIIVSLLHPLFSILYILYCVFSTLWFMRFICTHCPNYDRAPCPSGYNTISAKFFKKGYPRSFKTMFKRHIGAVFPSWFTPIIVAVYLLSIDIHIILIILLIAFIVAGFIILPIASRKYGCKNCNIKDKCPWKGRRK